MVWLSNDHLFLTHTHTHTLSHFSALFLYHFHSSHPHPWFCVISFFPFLSLSSSLIEESLNSLVEQRPSLLSFCTSLILALIFFLSLSFLILCQLFPSLSLSVFFSRLKICKWFGWTTTVFYSLTLSLPDILALSIFIISFPISFTLDFVLPLSLPFFLSISFAPLFIYVFLGFKNLKMVWLSSFRYQWEWRAHPKQLFEWRNYTLKTKQLSSRTRPFQNSKWLRNQNRLLERGNCTSRRLAGRSPVRLSFWRKCTLPDPRLQTAARTCQRGCVRSIAPRAPCRTQR